MIGENIKNCRQKKGYTQEAVANYLHVTRQTVSKWEKNYSVPDADLLVKLAEMLEVETSQLLGSESRRTQEDSPAQKDACAEQLAHIAEQLAVKNRQNKRVWKAVSAVVIAIAVILVMGVLLTVLGISVYTFDTRENSVVVSEETEAISS